MKSVFVCVPCAAKCRYVHLVNSLALKSGSPVLKSAHILECMLS